MNHTDTILAVVADLTMGRAQVAQAYGDAISDGMDAADWPRVNAAIMARWSAPGLLFIKKQAWGGVSVGRGRPEAEG